MYLFYNLFLLTLHSHFYFHLFCMFFNILLFLPKLFFIYFFRPLVGVDSHTNSHFSLSVWNLVCFLNFSNTFFVELYFTFIVYEDFVFLF